ncbi:MAG: hypothetical protein FJX25_01040 [Alphaproteobacteria bacterium]|nr:hypothetical protein [Alphaproteobacteria bacterium]
MKNTNKNDLSDRRKAATGAKAALLEAYRAAKEAAEPVREDRQKERIALAEAREARQALREQGKREEQARLAAEKQERDVALAAATAEARDHADNDRVACPVEDEAARKAARDRRYANRKARKG